MWKHAFGLLFVAFLCIVPAGVHAQTLGEVINEYPYEKTGLVPCGNKITIDDGTAGTICYIGECTMCHAQVLAVNVLNILVVIAVIFAGLLYVYAGVILVFFAVVPNALQRAKTIIRRATIGLVLVLAAWLVVDMLMRAIYAGDETKYGPWNDFLCKGVELNDSGQAMQCFDVVEKLNIKAEQYPLHAAGPGYSASDFEYSDTYGTNVLSNKAYQAAYDRLSNASLCGVGGAGGTSCQELIVAEARRQGIPEELAIAIAAIESAGRSTVISNADAVGLMQLLPSTGRKMCGSTCAGMSDSQMTEWLKNPVNNARVGVAYLKDGVNSKQVQKLAGGDVKKIIYYTAARYNGGPRAIQDSTSCPGKVSFECTTVRNNYGQTRAYVDKVASQLGH